MLRATGIGSLPFRSLDRARALLARFEALPFLPELPNLDEDDLLLRRPFAGLLDASSDEPRLRAGCDREAPPVFGPGLALLEATSARLVKVQVAGPNVLGQWVRDEKGRPLAETDDGRKLVRSRIETYLGTLVARLEQLGKLCVVFLDEPGLERPSSELREVVLRARAAGARVVGIHDCGPGFHHAAAAEPDFLSFDLAYFTPESIRPHVERGGHLAVGAVSTTRPFDRARAVAALSSFTREVLDAALVTPACGTALLDDEHAEAVHRDALALVAAL